MLSKNEPLKATVAPFLSARPIILDTDLDTDCDDAGALAVLHHLADEGRAAILGVICDAPAPHAGACAAALNGHFGRPHIPVAQVAPQPQLADYAQHRSRCRPGQLYSDHLGAAFSKHNNFVPQNPVTLYRHLLSQAQPGTVTICAIGLLGPLAELLTSPPDNFSPLNGRALVAEKVASLVVMAIAQWPRGRDRFNWWMDRPSAARVIRDWPTPLYVQPHGETILTGACFAEALSPEDPLRQAYDSFLGGPGKNRPSWDPLTVLWAVMGDESGLGVDHEGELAYFPDSGEHRWGEKNDPGPIRAHLGLVDSEKVLKERVERYMLGH